jgi:predicted neutral ceramidase superfamily lipid hydrolase
MFDYTILFISIIIAFGFIVGTTLLTKRLNISSKQLSEGIDMSKTISTIIKITAKELNFGNDREIDKIANIVIDSLDYIKTITNATNKTEKVQAGIKYVEETSASFGIELNEDRMFVVATLLQLGINLLESLEVK